MTFDAHSKYACHIEHNVSSRTPANRRYAKMVHCKSDTRRELNNSIIEYIKVHDVRNTICEQMGITTWISPITGAVFV